MLFVILYFPACIFVIYVDHTEYTTFVDTHNTNKLCLITADAYKLLQDCLNQDDAVVGKVATSAMLV